MRAFKSETRSFAIIAKSLASAFTLAGWSGAYAAPLVPEACPQENSSVVGQITVVRGSFSGGRTWDLRRDGNPWIPKGVVIEAFSQELALSPIFNQTYAVAMRSAKAAWGCDELLQIQAYGADTVRFQLSQAALAAASVAEATTAPSSWAQNATATIDTLVNLYEHIYPENPTSTPAQRAAYNAVWEATINQYYSALQSVIPSNSVSDFLAFIKILNTYYPLAKYAYYGTASQMQSTIVQQYNNLSVLMAYHSDIFAAINMARRNFGLTVILSVTNQEGGTADDLTKTPTKNTIYAWSVLTKDFNKDTGVMYEIFNEPIYNYGLTWTANSDAYIWNLWQNGNGSDIVSHQSLVNFIRGTGSNNVLLVDGVQGAAWVATNNSDETNLNGLPLNYISDDQESVVYAVHPYPSIGGNNNTLWRWQHNFGTFSINHPVIATEWNTSSLIACRPLSTEGESPAADGTVNADSALIAYDFLQYAESINMGVVGWAFDYPNQLMVSSTWADGQIRVSPTTYKNLRCDPPQSDRYSDINIFGEGGGSYLQSSWRGTLNPP